MPCPARAQARQSPVPGVDAVPPPPPVTRLGRPSVATILSWVAVSVTNNSPDGKNSILAADPHGIWRLSFIIRRCLDRRVKTCGADPC